MEYWVGFSILPDDVLTDNSLRQRENNGNGESYARRLAVWRPGLKHFICRTAATATASIEGTPPVES